MTEITLSAELRDKVRAIIADVLEVDADAITEESSFSEDFEADSIMSIEIFSRFERDLGIVVPQDRLTDLDDLPTAYAIAAEHAVQEVTGV
ncbi:acyl carrier protein [Nocardiopsis trehalosi]|jgi:acyl carrier protein|uniref:acyl carrier protein n=1 Tax=Nocardiopsis trehalosi TaxID=109329 RepID=UPI00082BD326|nr:phosphopantetheine-binding protein [Nocardiopsis trehalosi]